MINIYKKEIKVLGAILALKLLILALLPLTGDEAYFIKWADNLSMGYYDHPPMVGWVIYLMSFVADSHIFFRLFAVVTTFVTAFVIYKIALLYKVEEKKALFTSFIFLASPVDVLLTLMTNDVTLLFFSSLGTLFLLYSLEKREWLGYALLAGIFLGSAFLSKYFAVFLMFSLLLFAITIYRTKAFKTVLVVSTIVTLFIAQNLYFNYNSCWNNILFNFFARTEGSSYNIGSVFGYFGLILYILTPWGAYYLFKTEFEKTIDFLNNLKTRFQMTRENALGCKFGMTRVLNLSHPEHTNRHPEHTNRHPEHTNRHPEHTNRHPELDSGSSLARSPMLLKPLLLSILGIGFFIFLIVSLKNSIGLHWFLVFVPYIFLLFTFLQNEKQLKLFRYNAYFTFVHAALLIVFLLLPTSLLREHKKYSDIIMYTEPKALCGELDKFNDERIFTNSYSAAALLSHYCKRNVTVLFNNSKYGRFDDKLFDVRTIAGKEITLFHKREINEKELKESCSSYKIDSFELESATFYSTKCIDFNYEAYKKSHLDYQHKKFYNIPSWLPTGECYFKDRYYR